MFISITYIYIPITVTPNYLIISNQQQQKLFQHLKTTQQYYEITTINQKHTNKTHNNKKDIPTKTKNRTTNMI